MKDIFSVKNKIIVITGAGKGIGFLLANELSKRSAVIYAIDKTFPKKNKTNNYFQKICDITNKTRLENVCKNIFNNNKRIDVLINNAGITLPNNSSRDYSLDNWKKTLDVNLTGSFVCAQVFGKIMKKQRSGSIINITSINAELGFPNNPAYVTEDMFEELWKMLRTRVRLVDPAEEERTKDETRGLYSFPICQIEPRLSRTTKTHFNFLTDSRAH